MAYGLNNSYSFQKGKYGGVSGMIFPFFTALDNITPDIQYETIIPAGYLKCKGQILSANLYRSLSEVIGVGSNCIYRKDGVELDNAEGGAGGQIQLPDLGSKYIVGSVNPGVLLNTGTVSENVLRAGIEVDISTQGSTADFFYTGAFNVPFRDLQVTGSPIALSPEAYTDETDLAVTNFLPHGHMSTHKIGRRVNTNCQAITGNARWVQKNYFCSRAGQSVCSPDNNYGFRFGPVAIGDEGSDEGTLHDHIGTSPVIGNVSSSASIESGDILASALTTTVNVNTANPVKMDEFAPKYILCEYLIKY